MKSRILLLSLFSFILLAFFSCNNDDNDNPSGKKKVRLTKEIVNDIVYGTDSILFLYDEQNRIKLIISGDSSEYTYNSDGTFSKMEIISRSWSNNWIYFYQNGKIKYVVFKLITSNQTFTDTTFYFYDNNGMINKSIKYNYQSATINTDVIDYTYNNNKKLENRYENRYSDDQLIEYDSSSYTWSIEGNLTKITRNKWGEHVINYTARYDFEYDVKNNIKRSIDYPDELLLIGSLDPFSNASVNNCILFTRTEKDGSSFTSVNNYTEYNEQGFPLKMVDDNGSVEFEYEEY